MTYREICARLHASGIQDCQTEARILIEQICSGTVPSDVDYDSEELLNAVERRCKRYPLQYIIGKWWFGRCEFLVDENCLVPRPDTETVVDVARRLLPKDARFADLCTGSGCIAVSLLDLRPDTYADAIELYPKTLEIARKNAELNGVESRFCGILGDVLKPNILDDKAYDAIISNPPYIRRDVISTLEAEVLHEPHAALDGGEDGLVFYRAILDNFVKNLKDDGFFLFEIGYDQGEALVELARERVLSCEIQKDLGGCDRAAILRKTSK